MLLKSNFSYRLGRSMYLLFQESYVYFMSTACGLHNGVKLMWTHADRQQGVKNPDFLVDVINGRRHKWMTPSGSPGSNPQMNPLLL